MIKFVVPRDHFLPWELSRSALPAGLAHGCGSRRIRQKHSQCGRQFLRRLRRDEKTGLTFDNQLLSSLQQQRDSVSGVSLDEEAANLIRYQQAYQASGKVLAIASQLFATVLGIFS